MLISTYMCSLRHVCNKPLVSCHIHNNCPLQWITKGNFNGKKVRIQRPRGYNNTVIQPCEYKDTLLHTHTHTHTLLLQQLSFYLSPTHVVTHTPPLTYHNMGTMGCCCECFLHILRDYGAAAAEAPKRCLDYSELGPLCSDGGSPWGRKEKLQTQMLFSVSCHHFTSSVFWCNKCRMSQNNDRIFTSL